MLQQTRQLGHIESIRAIAALAVASFHFIHFSGGATSFIENETVLGWSVYGAQGVELFYAISGFIIPYSLFRANYQITDYFQYLSKRLIRLFIPYLFTIFAINLVSILLCRYVWYIEYDINVRQILVNVFFLADLFPTIDWINPIFATLKVELQFYILIGLLFPFMMKYRSFLFATIFIFLSLGIYTREFDTVLVNAPHFCIGLSAFLIYQFGWKWEYLLTLISIFAILFYYYLYEDVIAAFIAFSLITWLPSNFKPLRLTGKISYSYYLIHGLVGGWFLYFTSDTEIWKNYSYLMVAFALILSWLAAFVMYFLIEAPCLKLSARIKYGSIKTKT